MPITGKNVARGVALIVGGSLLALGHVVASASAETAPPAAAAAPAPLKVPANGVVGFVVSSIDWAVGPDANKNNCPEGLGTLSHPYITGGAVRMTGESDQDYAHRRDALRIAQQGDVKACEFPEAAGPDPLFKTVVGSDTSIYGIDLDGQNSSHNGKPKAGTCAHDDFRGVNGETGIDNQFYRVVGCAKGWQANGGKRLFGQEMLTGAWGILIVLRNVHNLVNDNNIQVGIYANADPIELSPGRVPLPYASYNPDQDPRFRGETHGRIVNGVLITDPVNVRFHSITNNMRLERPLDGARLRMKILPDGSLDGVLGGYTKVEEMYDFVIGYRNGIDEHGKLSDRRFGSASGSAGSAGITCNGLYHAMKQFADGERDSKTGNCNAISNAYRIKAVSAFVVEKPAQVAIAAGKR